MKAINVCRLGISDTDSLSHKGDQDIMELPEVRSSVTLGTYLWDIEYYTEDP